MYSSNPPNSDIPFKFSSSGYSPPDFSAVNFSFAANNVNLKSTIVGMDLQRDYLKHCETYVLGFTQNNVQILRSNCIYGGIRDLAATLSIASHLNDLAAYIKQVYTGQIDVTKTIKGWAPQYIDFPIVVKGWTVATEDLAALIKQGYSTETNILTYIKSFTEQQVDLFNTVKGWRTGNVIDIINTIRIWRKDTTNLSGYLKSFIEQAADLPMDIFKIWQTSQDSVDFLLHGWQEVQLQKLLQPLHIVDLPVLVRSTYFMNIGAYLNTIQPVDIQASISAWDFNDLSISIKEISHPGDLNKYIYGIAPKDLNISLYVRKGFEIISDLNARLTNLKVYDLVSYLNVMQYMDLNFMLASSRQVVDLIVKIYPKVINVKHRINISFLENRDLAAVINFPCFGSAFRDLSFMIAVNNNKDLRALIYAFDNSNVVDLSCSINASAYLAQDTITVKYLHLEKPTTYTTLKYEKKTVYQTSNIILLAAFSNNRTYFDLGTSINGAFIQRDLPVFIRAYSNRHYPAVNVREKFMTLKLKNNKEDFRRYAELTFNSYAKSYSYFSRNKQAYRDFSGDHWVIRVEGHKLLPVGKGYEKTKVKRKYIFNLKAYESIDAAIKDMVDRVTQLKILDLPMSIEGTNDRCSNLNMRISIKRIYKTNRVLRGVIKPGYSVESNLPLVVVPIALKATTDLFSTITGLDYLSPNQGHIDFTFLNTEVGPPESDDASFIFGLGDIDDDD